MNEAHQRFHDWLTAGAEGDPPRDVAVHASVCAECRQSIDAFDRLTLVDPGLASVPAEPTGRERGRLAAAGRLIGATAVLFSALILGVGVSQLIGVSRTNAPVAQASSTPDQNVLGETATPQPGPEVPPTPEEAPSETLTPLGTPVPTQPQPAVTPIPRRTPAPTPIPTAVATPIATPIATPSGLPTDSLMPTPSPTPTPTPSPSPSEPPPTPSPTPSPSASI
jgi:hypothetical protein